MRCSICALAVVTLSLDLQHAEIVSRRSLLVFSKVSISMIPRCDCFSISIA